MNGAEQYKIGRTHVLAHVFRILAGALVCWLFFLVADLLWRSIYVAREEGVALTFVVSHLDALLDALIMGFSAVPNYTVPALLIFIAVCEIFYWRSKFTYIGVMAFGLAGFFPVTVSPKQNSMDFLVLLATYGLIGALAGAAYWWIAGAQAGLWRTRQPTSKVASDHFTHNGD